MAKTYPSLWPLAAVVAGIVVADMLHAPSWCWISAATVCGLTGIITHRQPAGVVLLLVSLASLAGTHFSLRYQEGGLEHISRYLDPPGEFYIYGEVADWPVLRTRRTDIKISLDSLGDGSTNTPVHGSILLQVSDTTTALQYGDHVSFRSRIYPLAASGGTGFDYRRYLNMKGIFGTTYLTNVLSVTVDRRSSIGYLPVVDGVRGWIARVLDENLTPRASALARGYLIGETRYISPDIYAMFRDSGTLHLLAVSGSNVALVLLFFHFVLRPFCRDTRKRYGLLLLIIIVYAGICYGEPSVIRASLMALLVIAARFLGRKIDLNHVIALTALIILLCDPAQLFDVGFQLSFVTAWGLIFLTPRLSGLFKRYHRKRWYRWLVFPLMISLIAQVCSAPITIYHFGRVPLLSLPANLIIVPLVSLSVIAVLVILVAHLVLPLLGLFAGSLAVGLFELAITTLEFFGGRHMPVATVSGIYQTPLMVAAIVAVYGVLALAGAGISRKIWRRTAVFCTAAAAATILLLILATGQKEPGAGVMVTRVPGGVAALIQRSPETADLVISHLRKRSYPLEERVLIPVMNERGITRVGRMIIMSCDFAAIGDLLRFGSLGWADSLYFPEVMAPAIRQHRLLHTELPEFPTICYYSAESCPGPDTIGIFPGSVLTAVRLPELTLWVAQTIPLTAVFSTNSVGPEDVLAIGRPWSPGAGDWTRLQRAGFSRIVVSARNSSGPELSDGPDPAGLTPPEFTHDLRRQGSLYLP